MRAVCQRVLWARVRVDDEVVGSIGPGWAVLLGIGRDDDDAAADQLVDRLVKLRVFEDDAGKMNRSAIDVGAELLVVSQFTLYADTSRGRRPSFMGAAPAVQAAPLVASFVEKLRRLGLPVATGRFGAMMSVELCNDGPVTIVLSTDAWT